MRKSGEKNTESETAHHAVHLRKIDLSFAQHRVDRISVQDRPDENKADVQNAEHKRADNISFIRFDIAQQTFCDILF